MLPTLPAKKNLPPRILQTGYKPDQKVTTIRLGQFNLTTCLRPEFSIQVDDDSKEITDRWFVDPGDQYIPSTLSPQIPGLGAPDNNGIRELRSPTGLLTALSGFIDGQRHRVEVVVTDGRFSEDPNGALTIKPAEQGLNEKGETVDQTPYRDSFVWFVEVQSCPR